MIDQTDLFAAGNGDGALLTALLERAERVLVKKLSNNDRDWSTNSGKHQGGVYIPVSERDGGFFPPLVAKLRADPDADPIREAWFRTEWPQTGEARDDTRLVNYTSKGEETHMTRLPKAAFSTLSPASWLVMAPLASDLSVYECLTIDSASEAAGQLLDVLGLDADFAVSVLEPAAIVARERDLLLDFAEEVASAWMSGQIASFADARAVMPATSELASLARAAFLNGAGLAALDPYAIERPGDAIRQISRVIEWDLFREFQRRERAVQLVRSIFGDTPDEPGMKTVIRRIVDAVPEIDAIMLSASQQRKSRAGYSFEHQIEAMLTAAAVPFGKQVVMDATKRRPDFILPSLPHFRRPLEGADRGMILSAKTTLRERWKQVENEMGGGADLYLATVDENIAASAIEAMAAMNIRLVVPETLRKSKDTEYGRHANVLDFATFFGSELRDQRMPAWARLI
jgi:hypothetical protein